jgi:hypothetical protein
VGIADIQAGGRLVQQHQRRILGEDAGEHDPLPLAAGQGRHALVGILQAAGPFHAAFGIVVIRRRIGGQRGRVGMAAHQDHIAHREIERHDGILVQ